MSVLWLLVRAAGAYCVYVLASALYWQVYWLLTYRCVPCRPQWPFIGDVALLVNPLSQSTLRLQTFLDLKIDTYWAWISLSNDRGARCALSIADPACVKHMLKDNFDNYEKGYFFHKTFFPLLGNGIFNTDGAAWLEQRHSAAHLFKTGRMREFFVEVFKTHAKCVLEDHLEVVSRSGQAIDIQALMNKFTLDSIGDIAFGRSPGSLQKDVAFSKHFNLAQTYIMKQALAPPILRQFYGYKLSQSIAFIDAFAHTVIREKRALLQAGQLKKDDDVLARYLVGAHERGEAVSDKFLRDTAMNFLIAGRDTTAATLTWACYLISENPDVEAKLVDELGAVLDGRMPDYQDLRRLSYTEAIVKETLRLYPPVHSDVKTSINEDTLPNGVKVAPNTMLVWSAYVMGRHPDYWTEAERFMPERWLNSSHKTFRDPDGVNDAEDGTDIPDHGGSKGKNSSGASRLFLRHPWQYLPFQGGPRLCLGQRMAHMETAFLLACIYQQFHLRHDEKHVPVELQTVILTSGNGMPMFVEPRQHS